MAKKPLLGLELDKLPKMSNEDWILLILSHDKKGKPSTYVALMNEVFFFIKEFTPAVEGEFGFRGTGFGPYSHGVAEAFDKLVSDGFLEMRKDENAEISCCSLTDKGNARCDSLIKKIPKKEQERIRFGQFLAQRMGSMGMLQYLGSVHPEYVYIRMEGDVPV